MDIERILIVDDDAVVRRLIEHVLEGAGYDVWSAGYGEDALNIIKRRGLPHLAIVDINMPPGMDGFTFCDKVLKFSDLPIIMLSSEEAEETVVKGIDRYAEDYMVKPSDGPIRAQELIARVRNVLRRRGDFAYTLDAVTQVDEHLAVDFAGRKAIVGDETLRLTPTETKLLHILMHHAGRTLSNEYLLRRLWPLEDAFEERLHTHVYRLRRKIEADPKNPIYVISEWSKGYRFPPKVVT